jgi:hypothetical protein
MFNLLSELDDAANESSTASVVTEAKRAFKQRGGKIIKAFRCTVGRRKGMTVSSPMVCFQKKNKLRAIKARRAAKRTRFIRARKTKMSLRRTAHKTIVRLNSHSGSS